MSRWRRLQRAALALLTAGPLLVAGCGTASSAQSTAPRTASSPLVHLPADQANHPRVQNEWWYVGGHMRCGQRTGGYEVTILKFSHVRPPGFSSPVTLYRTDVAITDEARGRFFQRITPYFPQSAHLSSSSLDVRVGRASLRGTSLQDMSLHGVLPSGGVDLHLASRRPPMYVGGRGYLSFGNGYTYYYSLTDLASRGTIRVGGRTFQVTGISWLDHQWGDWSWTSVRGWTWMALQLGNGIQMSLFDVRSPASRVRAASVLLPDGRLRTIPGMTITPTGSWRSPRTRALYPSGWIVQIPALRARLTVLPTVRDQELTLRSLLRGSYWEGSGRVTGRYMGRPVSGFSYTELTGFAK